MTQCRVILAIDVDLGLWRKNQTLAEEIFVFGIKPCGAAPFFAQEQGQIHLEEIGG